MGKVRLPVPYKSSFLCMGARVVIWFLLFLPITDLLIQPSIRHIVVILAIPLQKTILADRLSHSVTDITLIALAFYLV